MQNKLLLAAGVVLIFFGVVKPNLNNLLPVNSDIICSVENFVTDAPADIELMNKAEVVVKILQESDDSTKKQDCLKLSALYSDMSQLIELDGDDQVINNTANIREANSLAGKMLRLNIKDKYPNLAEAAQDLLFFQLGNKDVKLDKELRSKAIEAFRALSWAFYKGGK